MKVVSQPFSGILVIEPKRYKDERGFFLESFEIDRYRALGINEDFVQDNHSRSKKNVLRGMHFTRHRPQAQLLTVMSGKIFDVVVDIRKDSSTFGQWFGAQLSSDGTSQIYMAHGFAHGFCVLSDTVDLHYKVSQRYDPQDDSGLLWNDAQVNIKWPIKVPLVSRRDSEHAELRDLF